ncbi:MAG: nitroreductase family protein [Candidatus Bathyarchaeota archaeon]|nr:nitroreductase family protein [Candidatus Bathyarchaeota archaeon]
MEVYEAVQSRKSVRAYEPTPIPKETLNKVLEAARISTSANNRQPWHFILVTDPEKKKALSKGLFAKFVHEAPTVIVACGDEKASKWCAVDTAIAVQSMVLVATGEGLGTCWVGSFDEADVKKLLGIPDHLRVIALLPIGYPREKMDLTRALSLAMGKRKALNEIVSQEKYGVNYP